MAGRKKPIQICVLQQVRPALGDDWMFQPHCRLELTHTKSGESQQGSLRTARLAASQIRSCGISCVLDLTAPMSEASQ